jgi:hypothetical protein
MQRDEVLEWFQGRSAFADAHAIEEEAAIQHLVVDDFI